MAEHGHDCVQSRDGHMCPRTVQSPRGKDVLISKRLKSLRIDG
jgi:hypothetical protein